VTGRLIFLMRESHLTVERDGHRQNPPILKPGVFFNAGLLH
jgi:hypothetical protein